MMINTRTVAHEPEGSELCIGQVDNLCDKQSALVTKGERRIQLTLVAIARIHCGRKRFTRGGSKEKAKVSNSSTGMS